MKLSRALAALVLVSAVGLGSVVPAASATADTPPITLVGPSQGEALDTAYPRFTWIAPAGEMSMTEVIVSRTKTVSSNGLLPYTGKNAVSASSADLGKATYKDTRYAYSPDTYYWQVHSYDVNGVDYMSPVQKFTVPLLFQVSKARSKISHMAYNGQRAIFGNATVKCNFAEAQYYTQFVMEVWKGKKKLVESSQARGDCLGMMPVKGEAVWAPPKSLKSGTKLTIKLYVETTHDSTIKWGGIKAKKKKGKASTVKLTWRW